MDQTQIDTLKNIELTEEGKKPQKEIVYVADNERAEILSDKARDTIIQILKIGIPDKITREEVDKKTGHRIVIQEHLNRHALSVVEIANLSKDLEYSKTPITKSQVYHHLTKLIESEYVIKYGTVTTGKRTTDYYLRTGRTFVFSRLPGNGEKEEREVFERYFERMKEIYGFSMDIKKEKKIVDLFVKADVFEKEARGFLIKHARSDIAKTEDLSLIRWLSEIYSFLYPEYSEIMRQISEILFEGIQIDNRIEQ